MQPQGTTAYEEFQGEIDQERSTVTSVSAVAAVPDYVGATKVYSLLVICKLTVFMQPH